MAAFGGAIFLERSADVELTRRKTCLKLRREDQMKLAQISQRRGIELYYRCNSWFCIG